MPAALANGRVTVLHYTGVGLFAEVPRLHEQLPDLHAARNAVLVLGLGTLPDVPSATMLKELERIAATLAANGGRLVLAGAEPQLVRVMERSGLTAMLGYGGVVPARERVFGAIDEAYAAGTAWIADRERDGDA